MVVKKTISIPDELNEQLEEYNRLNPYNRIHLSEIAQQAIYEKLTKERERDFLSPYGKTIRNAMKVKPEPLHKPLAPVNKKVHKLNSESISETKEQACAEDFFCNDCDTVEKTEDENIQEAPITKTKKQRKLLEKKRVFTCVICKREFKSASHNAHHCQAPCHRKMSEAQIEEIRKHPELLQPLS